MFYVKADCSQIYSIKYYFMGDEKGILNCKRLLKSKNDNNIVYCKKNH